MYSERWSRLQKYTNNMCAVVGDITSSVVQVVGYMGPGVVVKIFVMRLDLGQPTVALGERLKDINGERYRGDLCGARL